MIDLVLNKYFEASILIYVVIRMLYIIRCLTHTKRNKTKIKRIYINSTWFSQGMARLCGHLNFPNTKHIFHMILKRRGSCNSHMWVLDSMFSVGTRPSFQILDYYNGGTKKIRKVLWTHQIKVKHITRGMPHIDTFQE